MEVDVRIWFHIKASKNHKISTYFELEDLFGGKRSEMYFLACFSKNNMLCDICYQKYKNPKNLKDFQCYARGHTQIM